MPSRSAVAAKAGCSTRRRIRQHPRSNRFSNGGWPKAASTPSISLAVDVRSIGSAAERSEMLTKCRVRAPREVVDLAWHAHYAVTHADGDARLQVDARITLPQVGTHVAIRGTFVTEKNHAKGTRSIRCRASGRNDRPGGCPASKPVSSRHVVLDWSIERDDHYNVTEYRIDIQFHAQHSASTFIRARSSQDRVVAGQD